MTASSVIALDGGGSKTDAVALALDGTLLGRARGEGSSPHIIGLDASVAIMRDLVTDLVGDDQPAHVGIYLSGLDLPPEIVDYVAAVGDHWGSASLTVDNDLFALLRAGTSSPDAAVVVCGTGINALAIRADGETARFAALGPISGDWGGGSGLGEQALWHAARHVDGRGPATTLTAVLPTTFGLSTVIELTESLHFGRIPWIELARLSPAVFEHAAAGDAVAESLVDRQAEEIAVMAAASLGRLGLAGREVPIVLGGGVLRSRDARLLAGVEERLASLTPRAHTVLVDAPPILGAALLALETAGATPEAVDRARAALA